ncbi:imelysin family protein [Rhodobacteraceae bacterium NNCM2]|nr:imelysin family protein [Coraliihabitans acroporae]
MRLLPMKFRPFAAVVCLALAPLTANADPDHAGVAERAVAEIILPGSARFAEAAEALAAAAPAECTAIDAEALRARFNEAWDAWMAIQYLRFGPLEEDNRAFQIAFWPDSRGKTGQTVARMLRTEDPAIFDAEQFGNASVAARGFYALERLLYDDSGAVALEEHYRCAYIAAVAGDISRLAEETLAEWTTPWAGYVVNAGDEGNGHFLAPDEVSRRLMAVTAGSVEETVTSRLARPLGSFDKRRPRLAEARRAGRSLRQIALITDAAERMAMVAFGPELTEEDKAQIAEAAGNVREQLAKVEEAGTLPEAIETTPLRVETLMQSVSYFGEVLSAVIGPRLGIGQGFNAADGD